jgi:anti-sigma regulatory factor (Ser/Thr protein kinase)
MLRLELPRDAQAPYAARHALNGLPPVVEAEQCADAQLLLSELVTNSVLHGRGEKVVVLIDAGDGGKLRCEVVDEGGGFTPRGRADSQRIGGWGLDLVDQLASSWGVREGSTHVWFELAPQSAVAS